MILSKSYDVEVLPNFFSITIIDVNDYLKVFADCVDSRNKPIPLVQKFTVKEIKERLDCVKYKSFYITDKDDSQLLSMLGTLNNMRPFIDDNGKAFRTDMFGYNSSKYDKLMVSAFLMWANQCNNTKELITKLYELSKHIISLQDNEEMSRHDYLLANLKKNKLPYVDIDIMTIFALNKVGKGVDSNGNTIYFGKGLKQTSINLQWYELLEYELPPISEKDIHFYQKDERLKGIPADKLNKLVEKWDRYILDEWIEPTLYYNRNDTFIVCEMIRLFIDEIKLRYSITHSYKIDCLSSSRSNIADKLFIKFYSQFSGLAPEQWRGQKTIRTAMAFKRVIFPFIKFKTQSLQELLEEMRGIIIYSVGKKAFKEVANKYPNYKYLKTNNDSGWFEITINKLTYTIAAGGLHSKDTPRELKSKLTFIDNWKLSDCKEAGNKDKNAPSVWNVITDDSYIYIHWDISSFYPSIMSVYRIAPKHLDVSVFTKLITWLKNTRVAAKHSKEPIDGIPADILAQALKIVINSIYGKFGFEKGDLFDRIATLKVTINGQLMIMMLCEELELNGIEVMSANTDGIVVKLYRSKKEVFDNIANDWMNLTGLSADSESYSVYINRDINNYYVEELNGKNDAKGDLNEYMYIKDLSKGYSTPVIARAVVNYFKGIPILETLYNSKNILDFCISQNVGKQFHVEYVEGAKSVIMQRYVRFYVSNNGGNIYKVHNETFAKNSLCSKQRITIINSLDDKRIEFRDINYSYYYNECLKIIDPIKLRISPNQKGNKSKGTKSGKSIIKKYSGQYQSLFDDE